MAKWPAAHRGMYLAGVGIEYSNSWIY